MSDDEGDAIASIAGALQSYIASHPAAADTAVGIQRWWLQSPLHEEPLPLIELALEHLIGVGIARRVVREDGTVIYSSWRSDTPVDLPTDTD